MSQTKAQLIDTLVASLLPASDSAIDLGSNAVRFANIYGDTLYGNGANLTGINTDLVSDTSPQLGGDLDVNGKKIKFPDLTGSVNNILYFGTGDDLLIYHLADINVIQCENARTLRLQHFSGGNETLANFIPNGAVELYYDNGKKFETTSAGVKLTGTGTNSVEINGTGGHELYSYHDGAGVGWATGASSSYGELLYLDESNSQIQFYTATNLRFNINSAGVQIPNDSGKMTFGTGSDLEIYHDGSTSYIKDTGTGNLRLATSKGEFRNAADNENLAAFTQNGAVELFYDNSKKLETAADRVSIYGNLSIADGSGFIMQNGFTNASVQMRNAGGSTDGNFEFLTRDGGGSLVEALEITKDSHIRIVNDSKQLRLGAGDDLRLEHDGSTSYITNYTGNLNFRTVSNETSAIFKPNGAVELYYDNSKKFETTSSGVTVTGTINFGSGMGSGLNSNGFNINFADSDGAQDMVKFGASGDLRIFHDGSHSRIDDAGTGALLLQTNGGNIQLNKGTTENMLIAHVDGAVELYYDNVKKFETATDHVTITGVNNNAAGVSYIKFKAGNGSLRASIGKESASSGQLMVNNRDNDSIVFKTSNTTRMSLTDSGHLEPATNGSQNLGNASLRWANVYTSDLDLSNETSGGNDVDGTWGSYTIQEGAEDLFLINKRSGKKYKFNLTEVS